MKITGKEKHKLLAIWAADCAQHVLGRFEKHHRKDNRPRKAIEAARMWANGEMKISEARTFAFAAHAAAREAESPEARATARAAGHAAATAHVPGHAKHAAAYAVKASVNAKRESAWQQRCHPENIRPMTVTVEKTKTTQRKR